MEAVQYFIENLNLDELILKLKSCWIYLKFVEETIFQGAYNEFYINILISKILIRANLSQN